MLSASRLRPASSAAERPAGYVAPISPFASQQLVHNRTVKLSPLAIALSVAAGAEIGGIVGALLGIPVAGALKVVSRELLDWRRSVKP